MSLSEKKEEAEAVLDSAEMLLETVPEPRTGKAKDLEMKVRKLEDELQDPDSESSLNSLIKDIRDLMDAVQESAMDDPMMDEGMGEGGGMGPGMGPDEPPF